MTPTKMPKLNIRIATVEDADLLADLGAYTFWHTYRDNPNAEEKDLRAYIESTYDPEVVRRELIDEGFRYLVAEIGAEVCGYARLEIGSTNENVAALRPLEISRIYLKKEFQGAGHGRVLLERCVEEAERLSCDAVWLSVWTHNENAIAFYEKMGFEKAGTTVFDLAGSEQLDYVMSMMLANDEAEDVVA